MPVLGDTLDENDETFRVRLSSTAGATLGSPSDGIGTITDDDTAPTVRLNNLTVTETNGNINAAVTVTLSAASGKTVSMTYGTTTGGTATSGADYLGTTGTLSFAPGETSKQFNVTVVGDQMDENDETVALSLSNLSNAASTGNRTSGTLTITDDDAPPTVTIDNLTVTEGSFTTTATFTVHLSSASAKAVTIAYATANGTAVSPSDYLSTSGNLTINPGATTGTVSVTIVGNFTKEPTETFLMRLTSATNGTLAPNTQAVCTILDND